MELPHIPSVEMDMAHIDIDQQPPRDGMVEGVFATFASFCLATTGNVWLMPMMPFYAQALVVLSVSLMLGYMTMRWIAKRNERRRLEHRQNMRSTSAFRTPQEAEMQRKLSEAKASGAFDRWEN